MPAAIRSAAVVTAQRQRTDLVKRSPVDTGIFKNAWQVREERTGAACRNSAPYAGIIERGARPHEVSPEGIQAIEAWAMRHGHDEASAKRIARAVAQKLRTEGQRGLFLVRDALPQVRRWLAEETRAALRQVAENPRGAR